MADELGPVELDFLASVEEAVAGIQELIGECRDLAGTARDASSAVADIRDTSATTTVTADALKDALTDVRGDLAGIATTGVLTEGVLRGIRDDLADAARTGEQMADSLAQIRDKAIEAAVAETALAGASTAAAAASGASGLAGALAALGPGGVAGGIAILAGSVLALGTGLLGIIPDLVAATFGVAAFGALALPTIHGVITSFTSLSAAASTYEAASANLNTAIHRSAADMAAYKAVLTGLEPDLRAAAVLLLNQNVQWQNLSPAMQRNVIALSDNSAALKTLLPDQRAALAALLAQRDAWNSLTPQQQQAATSLGHLRDSFNSLVTALAPLTFKVLDEGLKVANELLPVLLPFAQAAGDAIDHILKGVAGFAQLTAPASGFDQLSRGLGIVQGHVAQTRTAFGQFMSDLQSRVGPTLTVLGEGIGQIIVAVGKLLIALTNPDALRIFKYLLESLAVVITVLAVVVTASTKAMIVAFHAVAVAFDAVRHQVAASADLIVAAWDWLQDQGEQMRHTLSAGFDDLRHTAADWAHNWASYFDEARANIARWADDVAAFLGRVVLYFAALPGKIMHTLAALPGELYAFGQHIIQGLINGALSMGGSLVSAGLHLAGSFLSSIGHLLGIGSPARATYEQGVWIGLGWANGILAAAPAIAAAVAHVSGLIGVPAGGLALAGTGALAAVPALASSGGRWQIDVNLHGLPPFGSPAMQQQFQQWMQAAALDFFTRNAGLGMTQYGRGLS